MNKDVDLRAQLVQPMDFPQNPLIGATVNDKEIIIPVSIANHSEAIDKSKKCSIIVNNATKYIDTFSMVFS